MNHIKIPFCYFPTKTVLVDNDTALIHSISEKLVITDCPLILFTNATDTLNYLSQQQPLDLSIQASLYQKNNQQTEIILSYNLSRWYEHIYQPDRFSKVTVLVLEQDLPDMLGLEVCMQLQQPDIKVILLSQRNMIGHVISAFNEDLIHQYISKTDPDWVEKLEHAIYQMQSDYFIQQTESPLYDIPRTRQILSRFSDIEFCQFFKKYCAKYNIVEYYLLSYEGDILMVDKQGQLSVLVIKSEEVMQNHQFYAQQYDKKHSIQSFLDKIKQRSHVLFLQNMPVHSKLVDFLHPAERIVLGDVTYYYSIVHDLSLYDFHRAPIRGFAAL